MSNRYLFLSFLAVLLFLNCKKEGVYDYRNQYTGQFTFTNTIRYYETGKFDSSLTVVYDGYVELSSTEKRIKLFFFPNKFAEPEIDKNGKFKQEGTSSRVLTGSFGNENNVQLNEWNGDSKGFEQYSVKGRRK